MWNLQGPDNKVGFGRLRYVNVWEAGLGSLRVWGVECRGWGNSETAASGLGFRALGS